VTKVVEAAADAAGLPPERLVSPTGLMRLLHTRPVSPEEVNATTGVDLPAKWCFEVVEALQE